ncbi:MAG TPA: hypothetical protein VFZ53_32210 [Polyangiaceae bacterium]
MPDVSAARALACAAVFALGCTPDERPRRAPPPRNDVLASPFVCTGETCTQRHVRLPDDGEWRCAEHDGVVWCAGGEPAAGVVPAGTARGYRCGARRGSPSGERVCVDVAPDYPPGGPSAFRCSFAQERGVVRTCSRSPGTLRPPRLGAAPNCWIDEDCPGRCERGTCVESG